jgi:threonine dehydrogenase-like Zn-dependent dehydrogenase
LQEEITREAMGQSPAGLFGYSHMLGGFPGGQAEYLRVPFADVGPIKIPEWLLDEKVLFLSDIFPTGYMAAENCQIEEGDTVAIWGCGPVGQFAIKSALMLGAGRVIAIDDVPERLAMAEQQGKAETIDVTKEKVYDRLMEMTRGRWPDSCMDVVGTEAHGSGAIDAVLDKARAAVMLGTDRPHVLREAIMCCRKGVTVSQGAKFRMQVVTELKTRGVQDILIACVDGLTSFPEAIEAVFPTTQVQLCMVHLVRHSLSDL